MKDKRRMTINAKNVEANESASSSNLFEAAAEINNTVNNEDTETIKTFKLSAEEFERINKADMLFRKPRVMMRHNPEKNNYQWGAAKGLKPSALYGRILKAYYQKRYVGLDRVKAMKIYKADTFKKKKFRSYYLRSWWVGIPKEFYEFVISTFEKLGAENK